MRRAPHVLMRVHGGARAGSSVELPGARVLLRLAPRARREPRLTARFVIALEARTPPHGAIGVDRRRERVRGRRSWRAATCHKLLRGADIVFNGDAAAGWTSASAVYVRT